MKFKYLVNAGNLFYLYKTIISFKAIHENYKSAGAKEFPLNDIAILELDSPIRFANAR